MASTQDLLLLAAQQEKENQISPETAAALLGIVGAGSGAAIGDLPQSMIEAVQSKPKTSGQAFKRMLTPGLRVKLAGMGGLGLAGVGAVAAANQPVKAAEIFARMEAGLPVEEEEIASVLGQLVTNGVA